MSNIMVKKLTTGTIYKLVFIGLLVGFLPLSLVFGIVGYFDLADVMWNQQPVNGIAVFYIVPVILFLVALTWTLLAGSVMALGLWIYSKFKPITLHFSETAQAKSKLSE
ncbi:hypothetical protein FHQ26_03535 [Testudinibacter sp. TR-2022]|uniref:hypothetical protein n=1 Tax=Testudinibacter sp. TR-2022 TaxID=2585029 RepID=UPI001119997E|nr:hypothetical protein [Testudinibacter sp. TR-2022]TNH03306.1 hypothetical protein FHQ22_08680 [Pasteurellaceae bacterium Phil31]TNH06678.1 hypothetical protein FHQ30_07040 [Pasteurellaceae bacterium Phil11]TNH08180.1 hypothetical protein FHQ25_09905 [Testudinibacter sp. TR-2022]TNH11395.1 hypothetical protein FHQ26_03535 [Testudinibacter sp. TR-2022]TNH13151.1 hypothetical protein FIA56_08410 [Testudinibacter sp. TR-2022]